jgi:hypothetical protein
MTCSVAKLGHSFTGAGCRDWQDSIHWKTLVYRLVSKDGSALAKGAEAQENVTADELQKALSGF